MGPTHRHICNVIAPSPPVSTDPHMPTAASNQVPPPTASLTTPSYTCKLACSEHPNVTITLGIQHQSVGTLSHQSTPIQAEDMESTSEKHHSPLQQTSMSEKDVIHKTLITTSPAACIPNTKGNRSLITTKRKAIEAADKKSPKKIKGLPNCLRKIAKVFVFSFLFKARYCAFENLL